MIITGEKNVKKYNSTQKVEMEKFHIGFVKMMLLSVDCSKYFTVPCYFFKVSLAQLGAYDLYFFIIL